MSIFSTRHLVAALLVSMPMLLLAQTPVPQLIKNIRLGAGGHGLEKFDKVAVLGNQFFFTANDGLSGEEPYVSNGTEAGTFLLKDIRSGTQSSIPDLVNATSFSGFAAINNKVVFAASDGTTGLELWVSDGSTNGTVLLKDIQPGSGGSAPSAFFVWENRLLFSASTSTNGRELWITDGTTDGTVLLKDIYTNQASGGSNPEGFAVLGNRVYFAASTHDTGRELWVTDGTPTGTLLFKNIVPETSWWINLFSSNPTGMYAFEGKLYFEANGDMSGNNRELWISDGTDAGTVLVKDINPLPDGNSNPAEFTGYNNKVYFRADDGSNGQELWVTDGTTNGTKMVKDLLPGAPGAGPTNFFVFNNRLCFVAYNQLFGYFTYWLSDGTEVGTQRYSQLYPNRLFGAPNTLKPVVVGSRAFWPASPHGAPGGSVYDFRLFMLDEQWNTTLILPITFDRNAQIPTQNKLHRFGNTLVFAANYLSTIATEPYLMDVAAFLQVTAQWTGSASSDWHTASNWSTNVVPNAQTIVIIPNGTVPCVVSTADALAKSVTVATGAELRTQNGKVLLLSQ